MMTLVETKLCPKCQEVKDIAEFNRDSRLKDGHKYYCRRCEAITNRERRVKRIANGICPICLQPSSLKETTRCDNCTEQRKTYRRAQYRKDPRADLLREAKRRAKLHGLNFNITKEDILIPERCPVLGIALQVGSENLDTSPSIDRLIPSLGYVRGNVTVISYRANRIKNDATLGELKQIVKWMEKNDVY